MSDLSPFPNLSPNQLNALEALNTRADGETLEEVAKRAGITVRTLHRYLIDPDFDRAYRQRIRAQIGANRQRVAKALIKAAVQPGTGQASMQKLFWQLIGDFTDSLEISGPDGKPIQIENMPIPIDSFPIEDKLAIIQIIERNRKRLQGETEGETNNSASEAIDADYRLIEDGKSGGIDSIDMISELPMTYDPTDREEGIEE